MIEVCNLTKEYCNDAVLTRALSGVSFNIAAGEFVAICGPSGSGKSTLMHIMGFLDRPSSGIYKFQGRSIEELNDDELAFIRNKKMGFVFQSFNLLSRYNVLENVRLPLIYAGIKKRKGEEVARRAIEAVGLLQRIDFFPNQLSGGEQQRVAIARALAMDPAIILADEPTGNIATNQAKEVMKIFQKLNKEGRTIVLITHEADIAEYAKRIIRLKDGKIVKDGV